MHKGRENSAVKQHTYQPDSAGIKIRHQPLIFTRIRRVSRYATSLSSVPFFSFSFTGVFQSKPQTSCHFPFLYVSIHSTKNKTTPAVFRTRCWCRRETL